ncbi:MAG: tRNA pseudouridine(54/55) synthase Pus10 [Candidatus Aenigmarchaeota archaeon ex4484_224]|nr:MAG: tRNA pseudouridine(54/55) synthase Pus10 [Candidatus Aenigmarchaeota archaeon ex4484_224]
MKKLLENLEKILKNYYLCNNCLGRLFSQSLPEITNEEKGKIIRNFFTLMHEIGIVKIREENLSIALKKNFEKTVSKPKCFICENFFEEKINVFVENTIEKLRKTKFEKFLIETKLPKEILEREKIILKILEKNYGESIKDEINREIGKKVSEVLKKEIDKKNADIVVIVNLKINKTSVQFKSLYIFGKYKKIERGFPQLKAICPYCRGKGCLYCRGKGKLYPTSIEELIGNPLIKATQSKKAKFYASGEEDVNSLCLDWRPFVLELTKPKTREINLEEIRREINESKKIEVSDLKIVEKDFVKKVKTERSRKEYRIEIEFEEKVQNPEKIKVLSGKIIEQKLNNKIKKIKLLRVEIEKVEENIITLKLLAENELNIKNFITGKDTTPSIYQLTGKKPINILIDVIKIHSKL